MSVTSMVRGVGFILLLAVSLGACGPGRDGDEFLNQGVDGYLARSSRRALYLRDSKGDLRLVPHGPARIVGIGTGEEYKRFNLVVAGQTFPFWVRTNRFRLDRSNLTGSFYATPKSYAENVGLSAKAQRVPGVRAVNGKNMTFKVLMDVDLDMLDSAGNPLMHFYGRTWMSIGVDMGGC